MLFLPGLCHNIHMKSFQLKSQGRSAGRGEVLIPLSCLRKCDGCALGCWDMQQEVYILWCVELLQAWANHCQEILRNQMEFRSFQFNVCRNFVTESQVFSIFHQTFSSFITGNHQATYQWEDLRKAANSELSLSVWTCIAKYQCSSL